MSDEQTRQPWPARHGRLTSVQIKDGRNGKYAIIKADCKAFEQTAFAFKADVVEQIKAAGEGAYVWFKGPLEQVSRTNAQGGTYSETRMKVVYFSNRSAAAGDAGSQDAAAEPEAPAEPDDLTAIDGIGAATAAKLNEAGVTTYADLAGLTEAQQASIDAQITGFATRARNGNWLGRAAELVAAATEQTRDTIEDACPF